MLSHPATQASRGSRAPATADEAQSPRPYGGPAYRWYVVVVLTLIYACHSMDRGLPGILVEPIKRDFGLTDGQAGLITGASYGIAFSIAILPMGLIADRVNRRNFLTLIAVIWSLFTTLGGFARSFTQMFLVRVAVGIAESGAAPIALPMIADIFPPNKRAFPLGVFYTSAVFGTFLSAAVGGWIAAEYGWRTAFLIVGIPGILLALVFLFTVREPRRGATDGVAGAPAPPLREVGAYLLKTPAMLMLTVAGALIALISITMHVWMASFFIRVHGMDLKQAGLVLGLGGGILSAISPPLGGWLADRLSPHNVRWPLRILTACIGVAFASGLAMLFAPSAAVAVGFYLISDFVRACYSPVLYAVIMGNSPARMRGAIMSFVQMASVLTGWGLGPAFTGLLSDHYGGGAGLRYAIVDTYLLLLPVMVLLLLSSRLLYGAGRAPPAAAHC